MRWVSGLLLLLLSSVVLGECGTGLTGTYVLDIEHLASQFSDYDPSHNAETEKFLAENWGGRPFIKLVLPTDTSRGKHHTFSMGTWHTVDAKYRFYKSSAGNCMMSVTLQHPEPDGEDVVEQFPIRQLDTGFCLTAPTPSMPNFEDCYIRE